jgi:phosphocarrier protein
MQQRDVEIVNKLGLHARPSAKLTQLASSFSSQVHMARNGRRINAKSIMGVMMLARPGQHGHAGDRRKTRAAIGRWPG